MDKARPRRLIVHIRGDSLGHRKALLFLGDILIVGCAKSAGLVVSDPHLAQEHFEITWDGEVCNLNQRQHSHETLLEGQPIRQAQVPHGGWVRAGRTDFRFYHEGKTPAPDLTQVQQKLSQKAHALQLLRNQEEPLFAVLDAARDERINVLLRESADECRSLYEGVEGDLLEEVAPYLTRLFPDSHLLDAIIQEGWSHSWGILFTSTLPFQDVRRQLRMLLLAQGVAETPAYFRFYDPRVLRILLPLCTPDQQKYFFNNINTYFVEDPDANRFMRFSLNHQCVQTGVLSL